MIALLLNLGLMAIMFEVGLTLTGADFRRLAVAPRAVLTGLAAQILLLPALAVLLLWLWPVAPGMIVGVLLIAAAPGGVTSNLLTLLARGDVALALTVTALSTALSVASLPTAVAIGALLLDVDSFSIDMPLTMMARGILITTLLPLAGGMFAHSRWPAWTGRWEPRLRRVSTLMFAAIVVATFAANMDAFRVHAGTVGPLVMTLNVLAMAAAAILALMARLDGKAIIAILMETGLQNAALAIYLAVGVLGRPALAIPAILYAAAMNVSAVLVLMILRVLRSRAPAMENAS
ncbi:MAG: bile acid:sodium symporter family protein [Xanthobacteraceae bacterium]|nr:MAG: bile acid:sodium symporter family protein [Xanthobacteraceae bacterium]